MPKTKKSFLYKSSRVIVRGWYWICRKIKAFLVSIYWFPYYLYSKFKYQQQAVFCECFMGYDGYHLKKNIMRSYHFRILTRLGHCRNI